MMRGFISAHPRSVVSGAVVIVALVVFAIAWFEPHKLFIDDTVDEAIPTAEVQPTNGSGEEARPKELAVGEFQSLEHTTTGRAVILELADGRRLLRFEDLETSNGPDLKVYLSEIPAGDDERAYGQRFVDLGALKGNVGNQNYELPDSLDLERFQSAVIWCRRFSVGFAVAPLEVEVDFPHAEPRRVAA